MNKLYTNNITHPDILNYIDYEILSESIPYITNKIDPKKYYKPLSVLEKCEHIRNYNFVDLTHEERLIYLVGPPKATETYSIEELENMEIIGLYKLKKYNHILFI